MVLVFAVGCADDIVLEPPPSLKGNYVGTYTIKLLSTQQSTTEHIIWQFQDQFFFMNLDSTQFGGKCFCAVSGDYTLGEGVRLRVLASQPDDDIAQCTSCNAAENPDGTFVLDQSTATLRLSRQSGDTLKELQLNPVTIQ
jgi:hypothetical protein